MKMQSIFIFAKLHYFFRVLFLVAFTVALYLLTVDSSIILHILDEKLLV